MNNNLHKVKVKGTRDTRIFCRSSFSFEKYISVWRGCGAQCSHEGQRGPPYSPHALTNARCHDSTIGHLRAVTEPVQMATIEGGHRIRTNARGNLHNRIGGSRSVPALYTTMIELCNNKPLGANAPKRNKL